MIRELLPVQAHDPDRGSFFVNTVLAKTPDGRVKKHHGREVYRGSNYRTPKGPEPHPYAVEYVIVQGGRS